MRNVAVFLTVGVPLTLAVVGVLTALSLIGAVATCLGSTEVA